MILSIVIPVYNGSKYMRRCIESVLDQDIDLDNCELIIINDGSKDNSLKIAQELQSQQPTLIKVIDQKNIGLGATRNKGIDVAQGKYLYFIDVDDYLATDTLGRVLACAENNNLDILTFGTTVTQGSSLTTSKNIDRELPGVEVMDGLTYIGKLSYRNEAWWYLAKREFILDTGLRFVEGKWMEDAVYTTSLFMAAQRMAHLSLDVHRYVKVPNSILSNKEPSHYIKVINDTEAVVTAFSPLIEQVKALPDHRACLERLQTRQDSFVFFMIVRVFKSQLSFKELWQMLIRIRKTGGYPITHFIGEEYNRPIYKLLTPLFNHKTSLYVTFKAFRAAKTLY